MKTELVSIVSHELRTPLASVLGFTALLLKREFDPPTRRHYLGIIDAQARRLAALLEDFLDVQRIEHEGVDLATEKVDLAALLDEQAQLYAAQSPKHRLEVELAERPLTGARRPKPAGAGGREPPLECDQVLPEGGIVELVAARNGEGVRIAVRDTGAGSPPTSKAASSRSSSAATQAPPGSQERASAWRSRARSSRPMVAASASTATRARASTFWLELPAEWRATTTNDTKEAGDERKTRLAARGRARRHFAASPSQSRSEASTGPATITINDRQLAVTRLDLGTHGVSPGDVEVVRTILLQRGTPRRDRPWRARLHLRRQPCAPGFAGARTSCRGEARRRRLDPLPAVLRPRGGRRHRPLRQRERNADRHPTHRKPVRAVVVSGWSARGTGRYAPAMKRTATDPPRARTRDRPGVAEARHQLDMVREVAIDGNAVAVTIALTVAGCPLRSSFQDQVAEHVGSLPNVERVDFGST